MKTSNKILIGLISFIGICCFCFMVYVKSQMIHEDQQNEPEKSGYILEIDPDIFWTA